MNYSRLFHTLYDEQNPVGCLGRGTHYSVLSAVQWFDPHKKLLETPGIQRFAIIWDEDHDERIIDVIERAYMSGIFAPVVYIGERKAQLTVVVYNDCFEIFQKEVSYSMAWEDICKNVNGDYWSVEVLPENKPFGVISAPNDKVETYFKNINNLWSLGINRYVHLSKNIILPPIPPI